MNIKSLGRQTDLIFARFAGSVVDRGNYVLIQTPSNPGYHWGNFLIFDHAPRRGDLKLWKELFDREFTYYQSPHHYVFTWDTPESDRGDIEEFLEAGFEFDTATVLSTATLHKPSHENHSITIRKISTNSEWDEATLLQINCADPKFVNEKYPAFKRTQMAAYRRMSEQNLGSWYGAYLDGKLVGDLGIFYSDGIGRYQNVETHPDHRNQGICGTLVYHAGMSAKSDFGIDRLVMEADASYHAARIYESVGFKPCETNYALSWWIH
jgi:hypothetical protein